MVEVGFFDKVTLTIDYTVTDPNKEVRFEIMVKNDAGNVVYDWRGLTTQNLQRPFTRAFDPELRGFTTGRYSIKVEIKARIDGSAYTLLASTGWLTDSLIVR